MPSAEISSVDSVSYEGKDLEALANLRKYQDWIMSHFRAHLRGDILEIGAGLGNMSEHLVPFGERIELLEPSPNLVTQLANRFDGVGHVNVTHQTLEQFSAAQSDQSRDVIIMVNVLEHIEDDRQALSECLRMLRPGGHLLILVPALQALYSKLDKLVGHFRRYERKELVGKIRTAGFEIDSVTFFDSLGIVPWWLFNTVGGATGFNPKMLDIYDTLAVPVTRMLEQAVRPPVGKNLIAVSRRPKP